MDCNKFMQLASLTVLMLATGSSDAAELSEPDSVTPAKITAKIVSARAVLYSYDVYYQN